MAKPNPSTSSDLAIIDLELAPSERFTPPAQYIDLEHLRNADDLMSIISMRRANGVITFAIFKEFMRDGRRERTTFVAESLSSSYRDLLDITIKRIGEIKDSPDLMLELQIKAGVQPVGRARDAVGPYASSADREASRSVRTSQKRK